MHTPVDYKLEQNNLHLLIESLNNGNAVAYLGAGISMSAGLPSWIDFVKSCIDQSKIKHGPMNKLLNIERIFSIGDLLLCSDLLFRFDKKLISNEINHHFGKEYSIVPDLHKEISRIPFSTILTTNYDSLIELAYDSNINIVTWKEGAKFYNYLRSSEFTIAKLHGSADDEESIILTKTQYSQVDSAYSFRAVLEHIFLYRTVLFIGSSLRDPDLHNMLQRTRSLQPDSFGPHFAIMFDDEVDTHYADYLWDIYRISTILCNVKSNHNKSELKTQNVSSILRSISGKTAFKAYQSPRFIDLTSPKFFLKKAASAILSEAVNLTGSNIGIISFSQNSIQEQLEICAFEGVSGLSDENDQKELSIIENKLRVLVAPGSILNTFYLGCYVESDFLYIDDVSIQKEDFNQFPYGLLDSRLRSILVRPIYSHGSLVGLIMIGSHNIDAYTQDHDSALTQASSKAGEAFTECAHRKHAIGGIDPYFSYAQIFCHLMDLSRRLQLLNLSYILYRIDYVSGTLTAYYNRDQHKNVQVPFKYNFTDDSLATKTLINGKSVFIDDVQAALLEENPIIAHQGVNQFGIKGPVYSLPIRVEGRVSAILVAWSRLSKDDSPGLHIELSQRKSLIYRLSHLIANEPSNNLRIDVKDRFSYKLLENFNSNLEKIDGGIPSKKEKLLKRDYLRALIPSIMSSLHEDPCNLERVRLWYYKPHQKHFVCLYSYSTSSAQINKSDYKDHILDATDLYSIFTMNRAPTDPFCKIQHTNMFKVKDPNAERLHKDPDGIWLVVPIIHVVNKKTKFLGYIAADNHRIIDRLPTDVRPPKEQEKFQRHTMDLIAEFLSSILHAWRILDHYRS